MWVESGTLVKSGWRVVPGNEADSAQYPGTEQAERDA